MFQHYDICKFLLTQTSYQEADLNYALGMFAYYWYWSPKVADMYRIFLNDTELDPDLNNQQNRRLWLDATPNTECLDIVLHHQCTGFNSWPLEALFQLALQIGVGSSFLGPSDFLRIIGLRATDRRLSTLTSSCGRTVMHYIGGRFQSPAFSYWGDNPLLNTWTDLGVQVLQNGANLCPVATDGYLTSFPGPPSDNWPKTPLLECLGIWNWGVNVGEHTLHRMTSVISIWAGMIQRAGIDLCEYGAKENMVWESLGVKTHEGLLGVKMKVKGLMFGPMPTDWGLMCSTSRTVKLFELQRGVGSFPSESHLPSKIFWPPTEKEEGEGVWKPFQKMKLVSKPTNILNSTRLLEEPFVQLVDGTQDDSGPIMLWQDRATRPSYPKRRSKSQPPCLRRRENAYLAAHMSTSRPWLECYHLCPLDSQWRIGCLRGPYDLLQDSYAQWTVDSGNCIMRPLTRTCSAQESDRWRRNSFLTHITFCQDRNKYQLQFVNRGPVITRHNCDSTDCPQGCSKVNVARLRVPDCCLPYHPKRRFLGEGIEKIVGT